MSEALKIRVRFGCTRSLASRIRDFEKYMSERSTYQPVEEGLMEDARRILERIFDNTDVEIVR